MNNHRTADGATGLRASGQVPNSNWIHRTTRRSAAPRFPVTPAIADHRSEASMAEEAAQEQPSPTVSRSVRCIVKLGTLPRLSCCPPRHASFPCVPARLPGIGLSEELRRVAQVERRSRTRASWRASMRRACGRRARSCGRPCSNPTAMALRGRFWGWTGAGGTAIRPTRPWTQSGSRGLMGWGSTPISSSCTAPVFARTLN